MSKLHLKAASTKMKANDIGRFDVYKLEEVGFDVSYHTVVGSKETIPAAPVDRVLIVINGFANTTDTKQVIRDGSVIELKAGETFEYQGQMKYYLVATK
ncbi:hypothetical protein C1N61_28195 (plasmid) [Priestia aryabhattai]